VPNLTTPRALWTLARAGNLRARIRANRDGAAAIRLHVAGAAVDTGLLDALASGSAPTAELATRLGAFLRVVAAMGLLRGGQDGGPWELTANGRAVVDDDLVRAAYQAFPGFHTALYREIGPVLSGGPARRDVAEQGELIARISAGFEPLVLGALTRAVSEQAPRRVLDIGCGAGLELAAMLDAAPAAEGIGVDVDAGAVDLARRTLVDRGLAGRAQVLHADVQEPPAPDGPLAAPFQFALLANILYYLPPSERVPLLRRIAGLLAPGGVLFVVTTVAAPQPFSRHFDLLLRAQEGEMQLSTAEELTTQLTEAGFVPGRPRPIAPGAPVVTLAASLPG
jgi:SAM-dependent methyltransferase